MPQKELSMRKVKEVLRLRFAAGLQQEQIARSCSIGQSPVHRYLRRAEAAGLSWPLPKEYDDRQLNELLFPARPGRKPKRPSIVDFAEIHHQLTSQRHVTRAADGYSVLHKRMNELFRDLAVAHVDGSMGRLLMKLSPVDALLLDDFAMAPLQDSERRDLLEICDDRYQRRSNERRNNADEQLRKRGNSGTSA